MADTDHHAALRELLASGTLSIVPSASIAALADECERLRLESRTWFRAEAERQAARADAAEAELSEAKTIAAPRVATVGELLATAPVIEICTIFGWMQMRADGEQRAWLPISGWGRWGGSYAHDFHGVVGVANTPAARLVPASEADRDPSTRGELATACRPEVP